MVDAGGRASRRVRLGISACLLGEPVRFDGANKRDRFLVDVLGPWVEWVAVCPEEEAGFGTPREAMRLVQAGGHVRLETVRSRRDVTAPLTRAAAHRIEVLAAADLDGFVLKKDSPSCGQSRVKVYDAGRIPARTGRGVFAAMLLERLPLLPVEDEGRLNDPAIREHFVERVFAGRRLRDLLEQPLTTAALVRFHAAHKLMLLAHSPVHYAMLGRLVASARGTGLRRAAADYRAGFLEAMGARATRGRHANVLRHIAGYFRRVVEDNARREIAASIDDYERGLVPLVVPANLLAHYSRIHRMSYLCDQTYLDPYPRQLTLRNHV